MPAFYDEMNRAAVLLLLLAAPIWAQSSQGPKKGTLIVIGGGQVGAEIIQRFTALASGPDAPVVLIPTANDTEPKPADLENFRKRWGLTHVTMLHSRNKQEAESK